MNLGLEALRKFGDRFYNPVTLVDAADPLQPLVYVNRAFEELTGYSSKEVLGKNCRFLQGKDSDREDVLNIKKAIAKRETFYCDLLNYRKDGSPFFNRLVLLPIVVKERPFYIGMQIDSSELLEMGQDKILKNSFENYEINQRLCDRINNALMKIQAVIPIYDGSIPLDSILGASFETILQTVQTIHAYKTHCVRIAEAPSSMNVQ